MAPKVTLVALTLLIASIGQGSAQEAKPAAPAAPPIEAQGQPPVSDDLTQMRADLNQLESLRDLMSSEIEFLHDQNLQILLRTNSQMWAVLTRDLRRLIDREEQRRRTDPAQSESTHPKGANERSTRPAERPAR